MLTRKNRTLIKYGEDVLAILESQFSPMVKVLEWKSGGCEFHLRHESQLGKLGSDILSQRNSPHNVVVVVRKVRGRSIRYVHRVIYKENKGRIK